MIEIEIIESPDLNRKGLTKIYRNEILFGSHISCDIILDDANIERAGKLEVTPTNQCFFHPENEIHFHVNRNKTNAKKIVKAGDLIELMGTKIKLIKLEFVTMVDKGKVLNEKLEKLKDEKSPFLKVLKEIKD